MNLDNFDKVSKLINLKNEIKQFHANLENKDRKLCTVDTSYDGPGLSYITYSKDLTVKIKELLYIADKQIDEELAKL